VDRMQKGRYQASLFPSRPAIRRVTDAIRRAAAAIRALSGGFWFILPIGLTGEQVPPRNLCPRSKQCI
jgi:hypothetical protein